MLRRIKERMRHRLTDEERSALTMKAVLTPENMRAAIARVKDHTTPGQDGVPAYAFRPI